MTKKSNKNKSFIQGLKNPHAYVIVFSLIIISMILTWIVPAGQYDRVVDSRSDRTVVDPDSFKIVESNKIGIFEMLQTIPRGIAESASIIAFIFKISGVIQVIRATGAIAIILSDGQILDTIVYSLAQPLSKVSGVVTVIGMVLLYSIIIFFIGSAAGRAAATLPILIPLSDILGITRQTTILAFILGGGITNMIWPNMIYVLSFADIPYGGWVKHIWKLTVGLIVLACIAVSIAYYIGYGPF